MKLTKLLDPSTLSDEEIQNAWEEAYERFETQKEEIQKFSKLKIRYFRTTPQQAGGAFARKLVGQSTDYHEFFKTKNLRPFRADKETHAASRRGILFD